MLIWKIIVQILEYSVSWKFGSLSCRDARKSNLALASQVIVTAQLEIKLADVERMESINCSVYSQSHGCSPLLNA